MEFLEKARAEAAETPDGKAFMANNFTIEHMGGGCTAWRRDVDDTGYFVLITGSEGCHHDLDQANGSILDREQPDAYLVGLHNDEEGLGAEFAEDATHAIAVANRMHEERSRRHD